MAKDRGLDFAENAHGIVLLVGEKEELGRNSF
jgi:hypothetical protein